MTQQQEEDIAYVRDVAELWRQDHPRVPHHYVAENLENIAARMEAAALWGPPVVATPGYTEV